MSLAFRQFTVYLRFAMIIVVGGGVAIVLFANRSNAVPFWFFGLRDARTPLNVIWLMLGTAVGTMIAWWALSFAWGLIRDWRQLDRMRAVSELEASQRSREAELECRERRVSEAERAATRAAEAAKEEPRAEEDSEEPMA